MRKPFSILLAIATALSFSACSNDVLTDAGISNLTEDSNHYVYVSAAISLPNDGTRSTTEDHGDDWDPDDETNDKTNSDSDNKGTLPDYEYGWDYENDVRSVLLVFANTEGKYICHTIVKGITQAPTTNSKFDFIINGETKHTYLQKAYAEDGVLSEDKKVKVYAYCNYTANLYNKFEALADSIIRGITPNDLVNWIDWSGKVNEEPSEAGKQPTISNTIWASRSFLMTNAEEFRTTFPASLIAWDPFTDKDSPYPLEKGDEVATKPVDDPADLTPIKVERAAARIDFRDGSKDLNLGNDWPANTYPIKVETKSSVGDDTAEKNLYNVQLTRIALVNMSKDFYYLRHVSKSGLNVKTDDNEWAIGGREKTTNYVVDVWAKLKQTVKGINPSNSSDYFNFPLYKNTKIGDYRHGEGYEYNMTDWYVDNIQDVLEGKRIGYPYNGQTDNWNGNNYKIWRYVTETTNPAAETINESDPASEFSQQKTIQSVGIIFKGSIIPSKDLETAAVSDNVKNALNTAKEHSKNYPYSYLYADYKELLDAAVLNGQGGFLNSAVTEAIKEYNEEDEDWTLEVSVDGKVTNVEIDDEKKFVKVAAKNGITPGQTHHE